MITFETFSNEAIETVKEYTSMSVLTFLSLSINKKMIFLQTLLLYLPTDWLYVLIIYLFFIFTYSQV